MSSKSVVAIVDPYSTGSQLAKEVIARGHTCVMVHSEEAVPAMYRSSVDADGFEIIVQHRGNLEQTCAKLRKQNVDCVIAGCELGVELSDQLSEALGLVTNGTRSSPARRNKFLMGVSLRQKGVRTPAALSSRSLDEVKNWVQEQGNWPVVLKPLCSSASDGVSLCTDEADLEIAFQNIMSRTDVFGSTNEAVLVQEYLTGTEYAVDTVSYAGCHKVVAFWQYGKPAAGDSLLGSDSMELLPYNSTLHRQLFPYIASVLDALEIKYGPAHCEVICSDDDPVIVEVGARLNGGNNPLLSRYGGGESQIELTLDAYLDPKSFLKHLEEPYVLPKSAMRVFLTPGQNGRWKSLPNFDPIEALQSYHELRFSPKPGQPVSRISGWVLLVHEDRAVLHHDLERIRRLEQSGLYDIDSER